MDNQAKLFLKQKLDKLFHPGLDQLIDKSEKDIDNLESMKLDFLYISKTVEALSDKPSESPEMKSSRKPILRPITPIRIPKKDDRSKTPMQGSNPATNSKTPIKSNFFKENKTMIKVGRSDIKRLRDLTPVLSKTGNKVVNKPADKSFTVVTKKDSLKAHTTAFNKSMAIESNTRDSFITTTYDINSSVVMVENVHTSQLISKSNNSNLNNSMSSAQWVEQDEGNKAVSFIKSEDKLSLCGDGSFEQENNLNDNHDGRNSGGNDNHDENNHTPVGISPSESHNENNNTPVGIRSSESNNDNNDGFLKPTPIAKESQYNVGTQFSTTSIDVLYIVITSR
jgi:hypothetical protein